MKILIGGDLVVLNQYSFELVDKSIVDLFHSSDYNVLNLESPITSNKIKGFKLGPYLKGDEIATKQVLKGLNINLVTLANNHILDYGEKGVNDTIRFLRHNEIEDIGAGKTKDEASRTLLKTIQGEKIAFINIAENEWSSADIDSAGAHPFDLIDNVRCIRDAKELGYRVILIIHGGLEYYKYPIPFVRKTYRFFAEQGADLIVSHHTHCIGGREIYKGVPIYYSLGNFLFTKESSYKEWYLGQVLQIELKDNVFKTELIGIEQDKKSFQLKMLTGKKLELYQDDLEDISKTIQDDKKFEIKYQKLIEEKNKIYLNFFSITPFLKSGLFFRILRKFGLNFQSKYSVAFLLNLIRCESHHAVSKSVFNNFLNKKK